MAAYEHDQNGHTTDDARDELAPFDDLSWTAFLYSTGELPENEAAQFESRLETDLSAQAALAQVVALSAGVKLAEESTTAAPVTVRRDEHSGRRIAGWMLLATAASVALWFAASQPRVEPGREVVQAPIGEAQHALAVAWAAGQPTDEEWATEDELLIVEETMPEEELLAEAETMPVIEEPSAPDWLIAALVDAQTSPVRGEN